MTQPEKEPVGQEQSWEKSGLPASFWNADQQSIRAKNVWSRFTGAELSALVLGSGAAILGGDIGVIIAAISLLAAAGLRIALHAGDAFERWFNSRSAAETIKSSAWKYAVGGDTFGIDSQDALLRYTDIVTEALERDPRVVGGTATGAHVTNGMRTLRELPLETRRRIYETQRLEDQIKWYQSKALHHQNRGRQWRTALLALEIVAFSLALVAVAQLNGLADIAGLVAAAAASVAAWLQASQHHQLWYRYSHARLRLLRKQTDLVDVSTEADWQRWVMDAEEAVSTEHSQWLERFKWV